MSFSQHLHFGLSRSQQSIRFADVLQFSHCFAHGGEGWLLVCGWAVGGVLSRIQNVLILDRSIHLTFYSGVSRRMVSRNHQPKPQVNYPSAKNDDNENIVTQETSESFRKLGHSPLNHDHGRKGHYYISSPRPERRYDIYRYIYPPGN